MKITDALKGEHGVFYAQFNFLEEAMASAPLAVLTAQSALLAAALAPHAHIENDLLFPALEEQFGGGGPTSAFRAEHAEIEGGLERLQQVRELTRAHDDLEGALARTPDVQSVEKARRLIRDVLFTAREHFAKEENMLFPMAEQMLSGRVLEQLGARWAERRSVVQS